MTTQANVVDDASQTSSTNTLPIMETTEVMANGCVKIAPRFQPSVVNKNSSPEAYRRATTEMFAEDQAWFLDNPGRHFRLRLYVADEVQYFDLASQGNLSLVTMVIKMMDGFYMKTAFHIPAPFMVNADTDAGCAVLLEELFDLQYDLSPKTLREIGNHILGGGL